MASIYEGLWGGVPGVFDLSGNKLERRFIVPRYPKNYQMLQKRFPELIRTHEEMGRLAKEAGPIDEKTCHLIQLAACASLRSEGGVHSHARRAIEAGASRDEIYHTVALLIPTAGFPVAAAAFSWVNDILSGRGKAKRGN